MKIWMKRRERRNEDMIWMKTKERGNKDRDEEKGTDKDDSNGGGGAVMIWGIYSSFENSTLTTNIRQVKHANILS